MPLTSIINAAAHLQQVKAAAAMEGTIRTSKHLPSMKMFLRKTFSVVLHWWQKGVRRAAQLQPEEGSQSEAFIKARGPQIQSCFFVLF